MATTRRKATRQQQGSLIAQEQIHQAKRSAEDALDNVSKKQKRAVFGDITNAVQNNKRANQQKKPVKKAQKKAYLVAVPSSANTVSKDKVTTSLSGSQPTNVSYEVIQLSQGSTLSSSQESFLSQSSTSSDSSLVSEVDSLNEKNRKLSQEASTKEGLNYEDVDKENLNDPYQVSLYAFDIFNYYKEREATFAIKDYLKSQTDLTTNMRAILVDWLVEVQENFELNHETLYLAVKMVDIYLGLKTVSREKLQLIGATALFIASKFDERSPPILDDFLYICDDAYTRPEMLRTEIDILKTIGFDLGIPLSYRFLRRYAKCCRAPMDVLTLGRYILEMSLMDYKYTQVSDSKLAAAALLVAITIKKSGSWNDQLIHYTGFRLEELIVLASQLNTTIGSGANKNLNTIRSKYSHKVFLEVATLPTLTEDELKCLTDALPEVSASTILDELTQSFSSITPIGKSSS